MTILIKGMKMPKNCLECKLKVTDKEYNSFCPFTHVVCLSIGIQDACPLVEIPEPHGSLIDKTKLLDEKHIVPVTGEIGYIYTKDIINAPTVIEAEGEE